MARVLIVAVTVVAMEAVAALVHRHWMHGPGWAWHRSHHEPADGSGWELNDLYALAFGGVAIVLFTVGQGPWWPLYWVAAGMTVYGLLYALVHDGLVHRRGPWRWGWTPRRGYLARLVQAHRLHHAVHSKQGSVSFGFLVARSPARLARQLRAARRAAAASPAQPDPARPSVSVRRRQGAVGLSLAGLIVGAWCMLSGYALWLHRFGPGDLLLVPLIVGGITWLGVGLFIVAHDALHGSLVPSNRRLNRAVGALCLLLYSGFLLRRFEPGHHAHHRRPGTGDDPDFHPEGRRFWPWYLGFMRRYLGWREIVGPLLIFLLLTVLLRAPWPNVLLFWALPALLASLQLFTFGTWLPHRHGDEAFVDAHRARSSGQGVLLSLLSCFHFGYHLEHHLRPDAPWWRLPALRRARAAAEPAGSVTPGDDSTALRDPTTASAAPSPRARSGPP